MHWNSNQKRRERDKSTRWDPSRSKAFKKQLNVQANTPVSQGHLELSNVDFVSLNANSSQEELLHIIKDNEAVIKMISKAEVLQWDMFPESTDMLLTGCSTELTWTNSQTFWSKGNCVWGPVSHTVRLSFEKFGFRSAEREILEKGLKMWTRKWWVCARLCSGVTWRPRMKMTVLRTRLNTVVSVYTLSCKVLEPWAKWLRMCMCIAKNVRAGRCCLHTLVAFTVVRTIWRRNWREEKI